MLTVGSRVRYVRYIPRPNEPDAPPAAPYASKYLGVVGTIRSVIPPLRVNGAWRFGTDKDAYSVDFEPCEGGGGLFFADELEPV